MTVHWSDPQVEAAETRGRALLDGEPRALTARYDPKSERIVVDLSNGATFAFPPRLAQGLDGATAGQLAGVEISGAGFGLYWESLDTDLSILGLLTGKGSGCASLRHQRREAEEDGVKLQGHEVASGHKTYA